MIYTFCELYGKEFKPSQLNFPKDILQKLNDPGDIGTKGKFKKKPIQFGSCSIICPKDISDENRIMWMAKFIERNKEYFYKMGVEDILLHILWHGKQGNIEFSIDELDIIAKCKIPISINYSFEE